MRVAIIGYGFVGKALEFGIKDNVEIFKVDPKLGTEISDLVDFKPNICFVCFSCCFLFLFFLSFLTIHSKAAHQVSILVLRRSRQRCP